MQEVGACGTAVVITPIKQVDIKPVLSEPEVSKSYVLSDDGTVGPASTKLYKHITGIQFGELPDEHGWCYPLDA